MILWHLAQTTQSTFPDVPDSWIRLVAELTTLLTVVAGMLALWKRQNTQATNTRTLAAGNIANAKAINASPGPNVPHDITAAVSAIMEDPKTPTEAPPCIDPVPPPPPRVRT